MRKGENAIQGELVGLNKVAYFTAAIIDAPHTDRGCRTKVSVRVDGDVRALWRNWNAGPHRVTCYGDITDDLKQFRRFKSVQLTDEVAAAV